MTSFTGYQPITVPNDFELGEYGLMSAVTWLTPSDSHWQNGIQYESNCFALDITQDPCIISGLGTDTQKLKTWSRAFRGSTPFTVFGEIDCAPLAGFWEDGQRLAIESLTNQRQYQLENTLWVGIGRGAARVFPNLTWDGPITDQGGRIILQPDMLTPITGAAVDVVEALGVLEGTFARCYSGAGVVHVTLEVVAQMCANVLVYSQGGKLYTWAGNQVVIGRGYDRAVGINGGVATVGTSYMFMTSPIFGIAGPVRSFDPVQSLDRSVNTVKFIAEQTHILGWKCCLVGVPVSIGGVQAGTFGAATT